MAAFGGIWKKFLALLPKELEYIGTVTSVGTFGRYAITRDDGAVVQATSPETFSVGAKVFVVGDQIKGPAPTLIDLGTIDL